MNVSIILLVGCSILLLGAAVITILSVKKRRAHQQEVAEQTRKKDMFIDSLPTIESSLVDDEGDLRNITSKTASEINVLLNDAEESLGLRADIEECRGHLAKINNNDINAIKAYRRSVELDASRYDAHLHLGLLLEGEEGIPHLNYASQHYTEKHELLYQIANRFDNAGKLTDAVKWYKKSIDKDASHAESHHKIALALQKLGHIHIAKKHFKEAIRHNPMDTDAMVDLGSLLIEHQSWDEGEELIKEAIKANPNNNYPYIMLSAIHSARNEHEKAKQYTEKAETITMELKIKNASLQARGKETQANSNKRMH